MSGTETRMPPVGADVKVWAYCRGCDRKLGYWHFIWDGEPRTITSHVCPSHDKDTVVQMEWLEFGDPVDVSAGP